MYNELCKEKGNYLTTKSFRNGNLKHKTPSITQRLRRDLSERAVGLTKTPQKNVSDRFTG